MGLRESGEDGALLRCSESRKVTLGRIAFLSAAFVFSASHPSAADITGVQERVQLGCGKEEFCLPTKLHAPSLADRVIGHVGYTLNAFGLFARDGTDIGLDNLIATFMILVWVTSNTGSPCGLPTSTWIT
jgi:hypothetical protein